MQQDFTITLDHVDEYIREEARKAVNKYFDFLQKTVSSYPLGSVSKVMKHERSDARAA